MRRASVYIDGKGQQLGPTKNDGARGGHWLRPTVLEWLTKHRQLQEQERAVDAG